VPLKDETAVELGEVLDRHVGRAETWLEVDVYLGLERLPGAGRKYRLVRQR